MRCLIITPLDNAEKRGSIKLQVNLKERTKMNKNIISGLVGLLVGAGLAGGVVYYMNSAQVNDLNNKIDDLKSNKKKVEKEEMPKSESSCLTSGLEGLGFVDAKVTMNEDGVFAGGGKDNAYFVYKKDKASDQWKKIVDGQSMTPEDEQALKDNKVPEFVYKSN